MESKTSIRISKSQRTITIAAKFGLVKIVEGTIGRLTPSTQFLSHAQALIGQTFFNVSFLWTAGGELVPLVEQEQHRWFIPCRVTISDGRMLQLLIATEHDLAPSRPLLGFLLHTGRVLLSWIPPTFWQLSPTAIGRHKTKRVCRKVSNTRRKMQ